MGRKRIHFNGDTVRLNVILSKKEHRVLERLAKKADCNIARMIRGWIDFFDKAGKKRRPPKKAKKVT